MFSQGLNSARLDRVVAKLDQIITKSDVTPSHCWVEDDNNMDNKQEQEDMVVGVDSQESDENEVLLICEHNLKWLIFRILKVY